MIATSSKVNNSIMLDMMMLDKHCLTFCDFLFSFSTAGYQRQNRRSVLATFREILFILIRLFINLIMEIPIVNTFFAVVFPCFYITLSVISIIYYFFDLIVNIILFIELIGKLYPLLIIYIFCVKGVLRCLLYVMVISWNYICTIR